MRETWVYQKTKTYDRSGRRWHFVIHSVLLGKENDEPSAIYFRDDESTEFGVLQFARQQDNPYRDWATVINKILTTVPFRNSLRDDDTRSIWRKHWK